MVLSPLQSCPLTWVAASTVSSVVVSFLIKYTGHYKYFVTLGACIYMMGLGLMYRYREEGVSTATLVGCQIATGIGGGLLNVPAQLGVQASASHQEVAAATAVFLTILEIGGAVGSAISGAIWTSSVPDKLERYLPTEIKDQASLIYGNVTLASTGWAMGTPERMAINRAYQETMHTLLTVAVCVAAPLIPLSLLMKNYKLGKVGAGGGRARGSELTGRRCRRRSWARWLARATAPRRTRAAAQTRPVMAATRRRVAGPSGPGFGGGEAALEFGVDSSVSSVVETSRGRARDCRWAGAQVPVGQSARRHVGRAARAESWALLADALVLVLCAGASQPAVTCALNGFRHPAARLVAGARRAALAGWRAAATAAAPAPTLRARQRTAQ